MKTQQPLSSPSSSFYFAPSEFHFYWEELSGSVTSYTEGLEFFNMYASKPNVTTINISSDYTNKHLVELTTGQLPALNTLVCDDNVIYKLDIKGCGKLSKLLCANNKLLNLNVRYTPKISYIDCWNNCLSKESVDLILATLDRNNLISGSVYLDGGTNSVPSQTGLISKSNLESKGWVVTINQP